MLINVINVNIKTYVLKNNILGSLEKPQYALEPPHPKRMGIPEFFSLNMVN